MNLNKAANKVTNKAEEYIVGIVALVAVVGLSLLIASMFRAASITSTGLTGAATMLASTSSTSSAITEWTTCIDLGNSIKLGNKQARTLVKKNACTGTSVKQLSEVFCVSTLDGGFSYKYGTAEDCPKGRTCKKDSSSAAYCG